MLPPVVVAALLLLISTTLAEQKAAPPQPAIPEPNTVKLSGDPKVASKNACPLVAWVGFNQLPTPNYTVEFWDVTSNPNLKLCTNCPKSGPNGEAKFSAPRKSGNYSVEARVTVTYLPGALHSNLIGCAAKFPTE